MWNILCFLEDLSLFFLSWFNIFPFSPPHHSLAIHYAVANILWREEGNTIQFSKVHLYSCEYENMGDISSGPAAGYLHSAGCLPYCPAESQSCFLSSKMFLQILLSSLQLQDVLIPLLVCFLICFFLDHLGRKHSHSQGGIVCFLQNKAQTQYGSHKKNNFVVFNSIQIHPVFILCIF